MLNVLLQAHRRDRVTTADLDAFLIKLAELNIDAESPVLDLYLPSVRALAERYRLTSYDAAYLELAKRRKLSLATFDKELIRATIEEGVPLIF